MDKVLASLNVFIFGEVRTPDLKFMVANEAIQDA